MTSSLLEHLPIENLTTTASETPHINGVNQRATANRKNISNMVAGLFPTSSDVTPPESPHRNKQKMFDGHQSLQVTSNFMMDISNSSNHHQPAKSPVKSTRSPRRATLMAAPATATSKSPLKDHSRRASYGTTESPTRLMATDLSGSLQNEAAQAPVVGRHKKNNSLVGFDPLLASVDHRVNKAATSNNKPNTSSPKQPLTPTRNKEHADEVRASLSGLTLSPPSPPRADDSDLAKELHELAKELSVASPSRPNKEKTGKSSKFGSLTSKFNLTPPFRSDKSATVAQAQKEPMSVPNRKLPWKRHRRSKSLEGPEDTTQATTNLVPRAGSFEQDGRNSVPESPMMQDLYDVVKAQQASEEMTKALALPSLARPAPTSFLTGKEIVRSSEQDPSPFQMEIPNLEQTLVAARLNQFVEHYRKEDMNLDLNMSLVGVPRVKLQTFALDTSHTLPNLTPAHQPLVEAFLETGDDVTMAGYVATDAGSADTRREAVLFERQLQFVVVFRGTTTEQAGKSLHFKKSNKQNALETLDGDAANANCKVYAAVKQAYMDLEGRVFALVDNYLDANPFCDVVFTGCSLGGAMATLGAFRYATNRPTSRVTCQTFGSPKVGNLGFRQQANTLPNLKIMRVEHASDAKCLAPPGDGHASHVGHSIVLSKNEKTSALSASAFRFDDDHDARNHNRNASKTALFNAFKKERDSAAYASALEQMHQNKVKWVSDFKGNDGTGVRGKDNEQRQMV